MKHVINMSLTDVPYDKIKSKEKTVEIRINDAKRQKIEVGDRIVFRRHSNESNLIVANIKALHHFDTFQDLFSSDLFAKTGCGDLSIDAAVEFMYAFYSKEQEKENGVLGIEICVDDELTYFYDVLKEEYEDYDIADEDIMQLARQLKGYVLDTKCDLNDILCDVAEFEDEQRENGVKIEYGCECIIFSRVIERLEVNKANAKRLYNSFLYYRDCKTFWHLMNEYAEWIKPSQREEILSIARFEFDECVWEQYVNG